MIGFRKFLVHDFSLNKYISRKILKKDILLQGKNL
jgi:hypothetical protein